MSKIHPSSGKKARRKIINGPTRLDMLFESGRGADAAGAGVGVVGLGGINLDLQYIGTFVFCASGHDSFPGKWP